MRRWVLTLGITGILLGCSLFSRPAPATLPPRTITMATETVPATRVVTSSPTPAQCPVRQTVAHPARPDAFSKYGETLRAYLNAGGDPGHIPTILTEWQAQATMGETMSQSDVNGDSILDTIVASSPDLGVLSTRRDVGHLHVRQWDRPFAVQLQTGDMVWPAPHRRNRCDPR